MDDTSMEEKHRFVQEWLKSVFAGEEVPVYEITGSTVDHLYRLAVESKARECRVETLVGDMEQKTQEFSAEAERLQAVLQWLGISAPDLSPSAQSYMHSLSGSAVALGLKDCSDTSFCLALTDLAQRQASLVVRDGVVSREGDRREDDIKQAVVNQASHKQSLSELSQQLHAQAPAVAQQKKSTEFLVKKSSQYQRLIASMKSELHQSGYKDNLSHAALQQTAKEIEELQGQLKPLKAQLASYQGLPPDHDLAKVKVEGARRELARLEVELSRSLDLVHAEK